MESISKKILNVSLALSNEKNDEKLLELILTVAMDITSCDAGTLYIKEGDHLVFSVMITKSMGGRLENLNLPPVDISHDKLCAKSLLLQKIINIPNVNEYNNDKLVGHKKYDSLTGYQTVSTLVVPMTDKDNNQIGVLQLINSLDKNNNIVPFSYDHEFYVSALASLATTSLVKMAQAKEINGLLDSLVRALSTAIYQRTPYNVTHTQNMVVYAERFLDWLDRNKPEVAFTEDDKKQFIMSVWLHDVGKLIVPLEVMNKDTRLGKHLERVLNRFEIIELTARLNVYEKNVPFEPVKEQLTIARRLILEANTIDYVNKNLLEGIKNIAKLTYINNEGTIVNWLTDDEVTSLSVITGTLTFAEREIMQQHVVMTEKILQQVSFGSKYSQVAKWASEHHEFVNGTGYPKKIKGDELCKETRILTILDVFDGISAKDRPYRSKITTERAFEIMGYMVDEGKLDGYLFNLFKQSKSWEGND